MNFPAMPSQGAGAGAAGAAPTPGGMDDPGVKAVKAAMESCVGKTATAGVMGFGMGALLGMFMASMSYDHPFGTTPGAGPNGQVPITSLPLRQQLTVGFKDMGSRSWSSARNFGKIGAMYSGIECGIEGLRAKNDMVNPIAAGFLTGGLLARSGGPRGMLIGAGGFAAFSGVIEVYLRQPGDE